MTDKYSKDDEIEKYIKRNPYRVDWPGHNHAGRSLWFRTLREAQEEADKHEDAEIFKEQP